MAVQIAENMEKHNALISYLVGDHDASTVKGILEAVRDVAKQSDIGHCKRSLGAKLYEEKRKE